MSLIWPILKQTLLHPRRVVAVDDRQKYTLVQMVGGSLYIAQDIENSTGARNVGILLPTSGAFGITLLGCWMAGRVAVPLNYLLSKDELAYVIKDSDIDTIYTTGVLLDFLGGEEVIPAGIRLIKLEDINFKGFPEPRWPPIYHRDDLAVILYTSGTSGKPKGVMLTHGNLKSNVHDCIKHARLNRSTTFLGVLPQFHSFGLTVLTLLPLYLGAKVVYSARFVPKKIVELIREHQPELFVGLPSMYGALLSTKSTTPEDMQSIKLAISGGEPLPDAIYEAVQEKFDLEILEGYGLTETAPVTNWCTPWDRRRYSVGKPLPSVREFIVDEKNQVLPPEQEGEILIHGPNVMKGYYKLPDLTDQVMVDIIPPGSNKPIRCFRTGDIGKIDNDGFLYITGRKKEMLIISGENIFPREIEEVLNKHPQINASAVIGKSDDMRGEVPIAFVETVENQPLDEGEVRNFCRKHIAPFKIPREIHVMEQLPRNPTGKIMRRQLKAE